MTLSCGCEMKAGVAITPRLLREHYKHTLKGMFIWELIMHTSQPLDKTRLSQARIEYVRALDELFPDASS